MARRVDRSGSDVESGGQVAGDAEGRREHGDGERKILILLASCFLFLCSCLRELREF